MNLRGTRHTDEFKRNAELEEENIILKKAAAIFMQHSKKD